MPFSTSTRSEGSSREIVWRATRDAGDRGAVEPLRGRAEVYSIESTRPHRNAVSASIGRPVRASKAV